MNNLDLSNNIVWIRIVQHSSKHLPISLCRTDRRSTYHWNFYTLGQGLITTWGTLSCNVLCSVSFNGVASCSSSSSRKEFLWPLANQPLPPSKMLQCCRRQFNTLFVSQDVTMVLPHSEHLITSWRDHTMGFLPEAAFFSAEQDDL